MGWTKEGLVLKAYEQIGLASYVFDIQAEQMTSALKSLDSMMGHWNRKGIRLGYPISSDPESIDGKQETGLVDEAEAVFMNLGIRLSSEVGKPVSEDLRVRAKQAYDTLLSLSVHPGKVQMPTTMPAGAGHKTWRTTDRPFLEPRRPGLLVGPDTGLSLQGKPEDE